MSKMSENKWCRLGRSMDRNESRKNVLNSWDRALSTCDVKWSVRAHKNMKKVSMFLVLGAEMSTRYCWQPIFWYFSVHGGSESCGFDLQNWYSFKFQSKTFFSWFFNFVNLFRFLIFFKFFSKKLWSKFFKRNDIF